MTRVGAPSFRLGNVLARHSGALICGLFLLVGLSILDDYGVSWDEDTQRRTARQNLRVIVSGDTTALPGHDDRYYGVAFEVPALLVERLLGLTDSRHQYLTRHLLIHLVFLLGGVACYRLVFGLFDNRLLAVFALLLFLLHPRLYAHSFFNSKDIPFASMFMVALLLVQRAFHKDTVWAFVVLGLGVGVLTNLRIMGLVLVPVVVALRAGDWWVGATSGRHSVRTTGAFVGASAVTLYVLSPYLWANPLEFGDALTMLAHHPNMQPLRFQGQVLFPDTLPLDYVATWFTITTPPVVLLFGLLGIGGVVYGVLTRSGALVHDPRLRFGVVLVGCFVGPILAVMVVSAHIYGGWRQLYFLYAPFSLLAVYGLRGVTAGCRRRRLRVGGYGLAGFGLGLVVFEMIRIHPYQEVYFNRLVDRTTPESLRAQYDVAYWGVQYREGLEYLLARYPAGPLVMFAPRARYLRQNRNILPRAARERIVVSPVGYEFYLSSPDTPLRHGMYARKVYDNTILTIERMPLQATVATAPILRGAFDIYLRDDLLVYVAEPCTAGEGAVFLHLYPARGEDLPADRMQYGFANQDFYWKRSGGGDRRCLRIVRLPQYEIAWLATGEYDERGELWRETFMFPTRQTGSEVEEAADGVAQEIVEAGTP